MSPAPGSRAARHRVIAALLLPLGSCCLLPASALAHGSATLGDFYAGMFHPLLHFELLLPLLALALWSGQLGSSHAWRLPLVFVAAALLGAGLGMSQRGIELSGSLLPIPMLVLGLLVAARGRLPAWLALGLVALFGVQHGHANTYAAEQQIQRPLLLLAGFGTGIGLVLFHVVTRVARHRAFWLQTAVRVLGSWIAATGLLVLVLEWTGNR